MGVTEIQEYSQHSYILTQHSPNTIVYKAPATMKIAEHHSVISLIENDEIKILIKPYLPVFQIL